MSDDWDAPPADYVGRGMMIAGAALAAVSVAIWGLSFIPAFPEWMIRLAIFKLMLASAGGLMVAGAVVRRSLLRGDAQARRELPAGAALPNVKPSARPDRVDARNEDL